MTTRLVLDTGPLTGALLPDLETRQGPLVVVTEDEHRVEALRSRGVRVQVGDPRDEATLAQLDLDPDTVLVAGEGGRRNVDVARTAHRVFGDAFLLAYTGPEPSDETLADLETVAHRIVNPDEALTEAVLSGVGEEGMRLRGLKRVLRDVADLAIVTHDNPDPDAIASGIALARLAEDCGCTPEVCYYGGISHQENRAFVNLLDLDLRELDPDTDVEAFDGVALVDHSRPGVNDGLPPETAVDVVIDHHPPREPIEARFVDLRSEVGATSTLLVDYLRRSARDIDETVATALLFGIRVDTDEFRREVSVADFEAAAHLLPAADLGVLQRVEAPRLSADTMATIGRAIDARERHGTILSSCVGDVPDRDALAQAADRLLDLEDVTVTLVYGVADGTIYASARARGADFDLGEVLRDAFDQIGSAGGHADMAGAQIDVGVLDVVEEPETDRTEMVRGFVADRFLEAVEAQPGHARGVVFDPRGAFTGPDGG